MELHNIFIWIYNYRDAFELKLNWVKNPYVYLRSTNLITKCMWYIQMLKTL